MKPGDSLPLRLQVPDCATDKYVRAYVRTDADVEISGSPVNLSHVARGLYKNADLVFPSGAKFLTVQYIVYDDSGYSVLSADGSGLETLYPEPEAPNAPIVGVLLSSVIVGTLDPETDFDMEIANCGETGIQDTVIKGSDHTLTVYLKDEDGAPLDLTGVTLAEFRLLKADGTTLSLKTSDSGPPVAIVVAAAGKLTCTLSAANSALLQANKPAPFAIALTSASGKRIVNLLTQLAVVEEAA